MTRSIRTCTTRSINTLCNFFNRRLDIRLIRIEEAAIVTQRRRFHVGDEVLIYPDFCAENPNWWTPGKVYVVNANGKIIDDEGDERTCFHERCYHKKRRPFARSAAA
jgi:hypothetical protein